MKKRILVIVCAVLISTLVICFTACGSSIQEEWGSILIGDKLPTPQKGKLRNGSNLANGFSGSIKNVNEEYYEEYKKACIEMGYTVESDTGDKRYDAFNAEGYDLSLYYSNKEIHITFTAPQELKEIQWPKSGIGAKLPATVSNLAKVTSDSSNCFRILVGNMPMEEFDKYVAACEQKGFTVDYFKKEGYFSAKDSDGFRLSIDYRGCNRVDIMIQTPKEDSSTAPQTNSSIQNSSAATGLRKEFKEAMDSYEAFFDEYIAFMKKYNDSDNFDLNLINDYTEFISKYADFTEKFAKWENEDLNAEETAYYIQVQNRVNKKILELSK